ncbi:MAG: ABC transporter permease [Spirochaetaceae bacterium]|nr:MAG: ABC transporter permease [Spirochaetaceae bacterium]
MSDTNIDFSEPKRFDFLDFVRNNSHLVTLLSLMVIATIITRGLFIRPDNLFSVIIRASILGTLAIGQTLVILTAGIDLCIAANLGLTIATMSLFLRLGQGPLAVMILGLLAPTLIGFINGQIVARTRVPPFIVTLGMSLIVWSINLAAVGAHATVFYDIQVFIDKYTGFLSFLGANSFPAVVWIIATVFWVLMLRYSRLGHNIYATGGKEKAAFFSGVKTGRIKVLVYTLSGLFAGLGAILYAYKLGGTNPVAGKEFVLETIAATVIGGTSLFGGEGKMLGTLIGALVMTILINFMNIMNVNPFLQQAIIGSIFIVFVYMLNRIRTIRLKSLYERE